jgi:hypothetical protein
MASATAVAGFKLCADLIRTGKADNTGCPIHDDGFMSAWVGKHKAKPTKTALLLFFPFHPEGSRRRGNCFSPMPPQIRHPERRFAVLSRTAVEGPATPHAPANRRNHSRTQFPSAPFMTTSLLVGTYAVRGSQMGPASMLQRPMLIRSCIAGPVFAIYDRNRLRHLRSTLYMLNWQVTCLRNARKHLSRFDL